MPPYAQVDAFYRHAVEAPGRELAAAFEAARQVQPDLKDNDVTKAILLRLKAYLLTQDYIKDSLDKVYAAPAADFFVETVTFYLHVVLERLAPELSVASERNIVRRRGAMRPDISIWRGDVLIAAIECKTQLGWNRDGWLQDFENREERLHEEFPDAKLFQLVMTGCGWHGFGNDERVGNQFFVLLHDVWPRQFEENDNERIAHRIELLITRIIQLVQPVD